MKMAFYGSSLLSSYWNGAATYYRGLLRDLAGRGYAVTFYEPDAFDRQAHRDMEPPDWARVCVYPATEAGLRAVVAEAAQADIVVQAGGIGVFDAELLALLPRATRPGALRVFWDVDAPATLAAIASDPLHPIRAALPALDAVFTYGGGPAVVRDYEDLGAAFCVPIYNAVDPDTHHPAPPDARFAADLSFLGNRLPDRETRIGEYLLGPARALPKRQFLVGGSGWDPIAMPENLRCVGHVYTHQHNAFNTTPLAVLNIARDSMAATGFSPATRVFEAAGAGACLITDAWAGLEMFLAADEEVLVARDGADVAAHLQALTPQRARAIGARARARVLAEHTYARRGVLVDSVFRRLRTSRAALVA